MAINGILSRCFAANSSLVPSLVDALLPRATVPTSWRIIYHRGRLVFAGGCFPCCTGCSCPFSVWMLLSHGFVYLAGNLCIDFFYCRLSCGRGCREPALSSFSCWYVYSRPLTTSLVVCNLCYEGSFIDASCNSLILIKGAIFPGRKKK